MHPLCILMNDVGCVIELCVVCVEFVCLVSSTGGKMLNTRVEKI